MRYYQKKFAAFPLYEWLEFALLLCFAGGFLDAYTFVTRGGVFANAQTGNLVLLAIGFARGDGVAALRYLVPILFFFAGVLFSELALRLGKKQRSDFRGHAYVLLGEAAVLSAVALMPPSVPDMLVNALVSLAAAVQFDNFRKLEGKPFASAFCTGNLRSATEHAFYAVAEKRREAARSAAQYLIAIGGFVAGVFAGYFAARAFGGYAAFFAAGDLVLLFAAVVAAQAVRRRRIAVRRLSAQETDAGRALIDESFQRFIAPNVPGETRDAFRAFLYDPVPTAARDIYGVFAGGMLKAAMIAQADGTRIHAFFAKNGDQRRGYGGRLMRWFLAHAAAREVAADVPCEAAAVYRKFGFFADGEPFERYGMRLQPLRFRRGGGADGRTTDER